MPRPAFFWSVSSPRAVGEAIAINGLGTLVLSSAPQDQAVFGLGILWIGLACALVCNFRATLPAMPLRAAIAYDARLVLLMAFTVPLLLAMQFILWSPYPPIVSILFLEWLICLIITILLRIAARLWKQWEAARRRRLRWSITEAQLLTVFVIVMLYMAYQVLNSTVMQNLPNYTGSLARLGMGFLTSLGFFVFNLILITPVVMAIMAVGAIMSYLVARHITRRIERLALATSGLRNGNYQTRLTVEGDDELAQLETDFNAMAIELEQTLAALKKERDTVTGLLQNQRELMAAVSHDLRTPIATMRGYLDSALVRWDDARPTTLQNDLNVMQHQVTRLQVMVDDLFTLSRAEVGRLTLRCVPIDAEALVRRVVDDAAPLIWQSKQIRIIADIPVPPPQILADGGRLEQILLNLVHNGLHYTQPGGIIAITASSIGESQVRLQVRDTGTGIDPEDIPHIWERYYQGSGSTSGDNIDMVTHTAGLGLALVKDLVEAMQGTAAVESVLGKGSCFSVCLPRA